MIANGVWWRDLHLINQIIFGKDVEKMYFQSSKNEFLSNSTISSKSFCSQIKFIEVSCENMKLSNSRKTRQNDYPVNEHLVVLAWQRLKKLVLIAEKVIVPVLPISRAWVHFSFNKLLSWRPIFITQPFLVALSWDSTALSEFYPRHHSFTQVCLHQFEKLNPCSHVGEPGLTGWVQFARMRVQWKQCARMVR